MHFTNNKLDVSKGKKYEGKISLAQIKGKNQWSKREVKTLTKYKGKLLVGN